MITGMIVLLCGGVCITSDELFEQVQTEFVIHARESIEPEEFAFEKSKAIEYGTPPCEVDAAKEAHAESLIVPHETGSCVGEQMNKNEML